MDGRQFDKFVQSLGRGMSRRGILAMLGGAAVAGVGEVSAKRRRGARRKGRVRAQANENANLGNSVCAKWCHDNFDGKAAGQCTAAAAKGEGPCYDCGPKAESDLVLCDGECVECCTNTDCCSPQVCDSTSHQCVIACGEEPCDPDSQKCCEDRCIGYDVCCTGNHAANPPVPGEEGRCLPNTNDENRAGNFPHVDQLASGPGQVVLEFVNPKSYVAFFEVRLDGERLTCGREHPIIIGDWIYSGECLGGPCAAGPVVRTYDAEFVEVRLALGGERDHDFSSDDGSGWVRFDDDFGA